MIPKQIHYCWFGHNELPPLAKKCIKSWEKYLPGYEIVRWDESNFDVNMCKYTQQAYEAKKYAFVSDYARFWILYNYGGLYFDTDVEVIKNMDHIIERGAFMGQEKAESGEIAVAPGLGIGAEKGMPIYKELLDYYNGLTFSLDNPVTIVVHTTEVLKEYGLKVSSEVQTVAEMTIYPDDYFCPLRPKNMSLEITSNSVTIHHYAGSWSTPYHRFKKRLQKIVGPSLTTAVINVKSAIKRIFGIKIC